MDDSQACRTVEGNEARAYAALVEGSSAALRERHRLSVRRVAGAYAFVAGGLRNSLVLNRVIGLGVWQPSSRALIQELDALYRAQGVETYAAEVAPASTSGLAVQDLQEMGFVPFKQTTMMYRDCTPLSGVASDLSVQEVGTARAEEFATLCCSVFGFADPFPELLRSGFQRDDVRHWMAFDGAQPVAAAMTVEFEDGLAWIGWVCTLPSHRGRGAQAALAAAQLDACRTRGIRCVTLEAATGTRKRPSASLRNYSRLGWNAAYDRLILLRRLTN